MTEGALSALVASGEMLQLPVFMKRRVQRLQGERMQTSRLSVDGDIVVLTNTTDINLNWRIDWGDWSENTWGYLGSC